jgi:hypothetical protein
MESNKMNHYREISNLQMDLRSSNTERCRLENDLKELKRRYQEILRDNRLKTEEVNRLKTIPLSRRDKGAPSLRCGVSVAPLQPLSDNLFEIIDLLETASFAYRLPSEHLAGGDSRPTFGGGQIALNPGRIGTSKSQILELLTQFICIVCMSNKKDVVYIGCQHFQVCRKCADSIGNACPVCRRVGDKMMLF